MGRIQSSEPEGGAEGYVLLEVLLLVALLGGVLGGIGLWQASIRLMEERRAESAAVFLVEGGLNQMETRLTRGYVAELAEHVEKNTILYHVESQTERIEPASSAYVYRVVVEASWELEVHGEMRQRSYRDERLIWVDEERD